MKTDVQLRLLCYCGRHCTEPIRIFLHETRPYRNRRTETKRPRR